MIDALDAFAGVWRRWRRPPEQAPPSLATDPLAGLPDRLAFISRCQAAQGSLAIITVDIDHLQHLNHALGRDAGDDILNAVAGALQASATERDGVARTGGDEFTILIESASTAIVGGAAEQVRSTVAEFVCGPPALRVSVGWAVGSPGDDGLTVWARADEALARAKREGGNRVAGSMAPRAATGSPGRGWNNLLSGVLASQQINPVYQPIVSLVDQRVVAYEGLARPVSLDAADSVEDFFATAHQLGVINELDWICRRAVVGLAKGLGADAILYCNIDLSAVTDPDADVDQMLSLLQLAGRDPRALVLEVTDAGRFASVAQLQSHLETYRRAGLRFAIDDAGKEGLDTGLLRAVRPDVIKIDASVTNRCREADARAFIQQAVALAGEIGALVVAEGIEDRATADELTRLGVGHGQGFLFGRPAALPGRSRDGEIEPAKPAGVAAPRQAGAGMRLVRQISA